MSGRKGKRHPGAGLFLILVCFLLAGCSGKKTPAEGTGTGERQTDPGSQTITESAQAAPTVTPTEAPVQIRKEFAAALVKAYAAGESGQCESLLTEIRDRATVPIIVSPQEMKKDPRSTREKEILMNKDIYAADLYRAILTDRLHQSFPTEYTRKFQN